LNNNSDNTVEIPSSPNLRSFITKKLQQCTDSKEELIRMWQLKTYYIILLPLSTTDIISNKRHENSKQL